MARDPFAQVEDAPLFIVPRVLGALSAYRAAPIFDGLSGNDTGAERALLTAELDRLLEKLLAGIERYPTKFWVLKQFQQSLLAIENQAAEARAHFGLALKEVMDILGIESSDGLLNWYLGGLERMPR
jgi:FKBP-type peptidyl-prolyl cis-trans isomerase (trigger factor)